jgi:predicted porin
MNKKLLAVAVAGALAAPGMAFAQASTVTISGNFKLGVESLNYSNASATRLNSSQMRVVDNSSRIIFTSVEALGNGLSAVGNLDVRFAPDQASAAPTSNPIGNGNTYVGLRSTTWGQLTVGRWDLHYGKAPSDLTNNAGALGAATTSLFDFMQVGAANSPIANTSRTQNVVRYDLPNFSGFTGTVAWSANPIGNSDADMSATNAAGVATRKGDGWNINPKYSNGPFAIEYSYWRAKGDAPALTGLDQRSDVIAGSYQFGAFKLGLGWNRSRMDTASNILVANAVSTGAVGSGTKAAERTAWALAGNYAWGPNTILAHYVRAGNISSNTGLTTASTGARMWALAYQYALSKRTALAATYAKIDNDSAASYNFFTSAALGSNDAGLVGLGESPRLFQLTINHQY